MSKKVTITGGGGFIGAYLTKKMVADGWIVSVIDSMVRGDASRLSSVANHIQVHSIDIRDEDAVAKAIKGSDVVMHLAAINGTENFYKQPELVLDVGLRGALAVVNACRRVGVFDLVVASSAEVYQTPEIIPTPESVHLMLPDSLNPRYSYGGSKIVSELIAFNYAREHFRKVQVFRPHNVYGPDMGWKHVIPQLIIRAADALNGEKKSAPFKIQGNGHETRAFCFVDDVVDGILSMYEKGEHREVYHIGNDHEVSIRELVARLGAAMGGELLIEPSVGFEGGTSRRCPDIAKMRSLGYEPKIDLEQGLLKTIDWYMAKRKSEITNELL